MCTKGSGKLPFQSISGSKAMDWNFQSVKYLLELVQQYDGRKSGDLEAEYQERKRLSMPTLWREFLGFGFFCPSGI